ncbi:MAG TPA: glycosyltransferase [Actinomycetota bacterium]|nr:glycosyltransferase [Actinomycetota bacterium]
MKILLWHGYLLTGSGSNLYTANLARVWRNAGHDVLLMCQEKNVDAVPFLDSYGDFAPDNLSFEETEMGNQAAKGSCRLLRPSIGKVLPVYVYDEYEGFEAKTYVDLTDEELAQYTNSNITAMVTALRAHEPDAIVTGHEVMGPYIALRACETTGDDYLAKLHGSALEYAVKKQERYVAYARDGLGGAKVVVGGSRYMIKEAASIVSGWEEKAEVVNPGCDTILFKPIEKANEIPVVGYVGKLIAAKGVHNFLASLGLVENLPLKAVVVGYGGYESELKRLWDALREGRADEVREIASAHLSELPHLLQWLETDRPGVSYQSRIESVDLEWAGRLDHDPLSRVLPTVDALVVPSVVPEAFGMVAAEAAACAVLPIVPRHSGIGEVGAALEKELGQPGLLTFDPDDPIKGIAAAIDRVLALHVEEKRVFEQAACEYARSVWSWEHVGDRLLDLAAN